MGDGIGDMAFWLAVGLIGLGVTFGPIGRAIARTVELSVDAVVGRLFGRGSAERAEELEQLQQRVGELEGVETRLLELEERLDFAERLLTRGRDEGGREADTPPEPVESAR